MIYYLNGEDCMATGHLRMWLAQNDHIAICPVDVQEAMPTLDNVKLMKLCYELINMCDCVLVPRGWEKTIIGKAEIGYAKSVGKKVHFESKQWALEKPKKVELISENG